MGLRRARRKHLLSEPLVFSYGSEPRAICLYPEPICCCLVNIGSQYSLSLFLTLEWEKGPQTQRALPKAHRLPWSIQRGGRECESEGETGKETERVPFLSIISVFPHFPKFIPFRLSPSGYSSLSNAWVVKLLPARKECGSQFPRTEGTLIHLEPSQKCLKFLILCLPPPQYQKQGSVRGSQFLPPNSSQYWSHRESTPSSDWSWVDPGEETAGTPSLPRCGFQGRARALTLAGLGWGRWVRGRGRGIHARFYSLSPFNVSKRKRFTKDYTWITYSQYLKIQEYLTGIFFLAINICITLGC